MEEVQGICGREEGRLARQENVCLAMAVLSCLVRRTFPSIAPIVELYLLRQAFYRTDASLFQTGEVQYIFVG
jgi:hypothetical protein